MATNQSSVGADLLAALSQFFELFPGERANPLYVTGESYAGKYVPACAYAIHARNAQLPPLKRINLQGISIGDGAFAPEVQLSGGFGDLLLLQQSIDRSFYAWQLHGEQRHRIHWRCLHVG